MRSTKRTRVSAGGALSSFARVVIAVVLSLSVLGGGACDEADELRNIERGRDNRPAINETPPDEAN